MDKREEALQELRRLIREQRARLDPRLLELAAQAARLSQQPPENAEFVPYDHDAAAKAIRLFLKNHDNPAAFEQQLLRLLDKTKH